MKRRIIWLVILPWRSGLYFLLDGMLWRQLTFEWVPRGDRSMISPASGGDFLLPCWLFWRALPAAGFLLNITGENTSDFENFMSICWCVGKSSFIYVVCLPEITAVARVNFGFILLSVGFIIILILWNSFWKLQILVFIPAVNLFV